MHLTYNENIKTLEDAMRHLELEEDVLIVCHTPIPGSTRLADPNRFRGTRTYIGTLYLIFFFKAELVPVGMAHIL